MADRSLSKEEIRQQHPLYGQERIEVHHQLPRHRGGDDSNENKIPETLPEHALAHLRLAEETNDWSVAKKDYGAVRLIVGRMTEHELEEFNAQLPTTRKR